MRWIQPWVIIIFSGNLNCMFSSILKKRKKSVCSRWKPWLASDRLEFQRLPHTNLRGKKKNRPHEIDQCCSVVYKSSISVCSLAVSMPVSTGVFSVSIRLSFVTDPWWSGEEERDLGCSGVSFHEECDGISFPSTRQNHKSQNLPAWSRKWG